MNQNIQTKTKLIFKTFFLVLICVFATSALATWTNPSANPPGGNALPPLNTGITSQAKAGGLVLGGLLVNGYADITNNLTTVGSIGVGVPNPTAKLEVAGQVKITGGLPALNKVLASDASGLASWKSLNELGGTGGEGSGWTDEGAYVRQTTLSDDLLMGYNTRIYKSTINQIDPANRFLHTSGPGGASTNLFLGLGAGSFSPTASGHTGIGHNALFGLTSGVGDTALGDSALASNTSGSNNTAVGVGTMDSNTSGINNSALGKNALGANTTGISNTAIGTEAMNNNVSGKENSAFGAYALNQNRGNWNTAVGFNALATNVLGSYNTAIGYGADITTPPGEASYSNLTAIGANAKVTGDNKVRIGNDTVQWIGGAVPWSSLSDVRFKKNVEDLDLGLNFINSLRPVSYQMKSDTDDRKSFGFIAQEVEKVLGDRPAKLVTTENTADAYKNMRYDDLIAPMVKAIQEQQKEIEELKAEIESMKN